MGVAQEVLVLRRERLAAGRRRGASAVVAGRPDRLVGVAASSSSRTAMAPPLVTSRAVTSSTGLLVLGSLTTS